MLEPAPARSAKTAPTTPARAASARARAPRAPTTTPLQPAPVSYRGTRTALGAVRVTREQAGVSRPLNPGLNVARHSVTGVEWGYPGAGPHQLAVALLADAAGAGAATPEAAMRLYRQVTAQLPRKGWTLTRDEVLKGAGVAVGPSAAPKPVPWGQGTSGARRRA